MNPECQTSIAMTYSNDKEDLTKKMVVKNLERELTNYLASLAIETLKLRLSFVTVIYHKQCIAYKRNDFTNTARSTSSNDKNISSL